LRDDWSTPTFASTWSRSGGHFAGGRGWHPGGHLPTTSWPSPTAATAASRTTMWRGNCLALLSHLVPSGVWEAVYIVEGLPANRSDAQPETVYADTQDQS